MTIGYFFFASKFDGLNSCPYRSVLPSRALTVNDSGATQPAAFNRDRSVRASSASCLPSASRTSTTGAVSMVETTSTKRLPSFDTVIAWLAFSGVSNCTSPPSMPTL